MSKGNPFIGIRIPQATLDAIDAVILRCNKKQVDKEPITRNDFLRMAIEEKLAKMERSRNGKKKPKPPSA